MREAPAAIASGAGPGRSPGCPTAGPTIRNAKELRRQARAAGDPCQVARVRASVSTASAEALGRVLELLVAEGKVRAADVEAAFGKYRMLTDGPGR